VIGIQRSTSLPKSHTSNTMTANAIPANATANMVKSVKSLNYKLVFEGYTKTQLPSRKGLKSLSQTGIFDRILIVLSTGWTIFQIPCAG
jgi:hypothetical protein